jgi:hypothetical protein
MNLGGVSEAAAPCADVSALAAPQSTVACGFGTPRIQPILRLYPDKAIRRAGDVRFGPAELKVMLPFIGSGEIVWAVTVREPGRYNLALCYSTTNEGQPVSISANGNRIDFAAPLTRGFFIPDPRGPAQNPGDPDSDTFWQMRGYYLFERKPVRGSLELTRGVNIVSLKVTAPKGREVFRLRSLELTPVEALETIQADAKRAKASRANTDWFANAGYGLWFCFLDLTTPRRGPPKPYGDSVAALDVKRMAKTVHDCGAAYLLFTVNHGDPTCPAPIRSWEKLHPGWTTKRDLIAELADALGEYGIHLMLYMNCPGAGMLIQQPGSAIDLPTFGEAEYANQLIAIFEEFGARYGDKIKGWWLDSWFQTMEAYPNLPNEAIDRAIKSGFKDCLVSVNHWAFPTEVQWQDYWCGEITDLPARPFEARHLNYGPGVGLQAHSAIRLDAPWFHITQDKPMEPPRYSASQLADYIRTCHADGAPVTLGVGIYQDGTIGEKSAAVLQELRHLTRGGGGGLPQ